MYKYKWYASYIYRYSFVLLLSGFLISSCHTTQKATRTKKESSSLFSNRHLTVRKVLESLKTHHVDYKTLSGRLKISIHSKEHNQNNITAYLRMKKDSAIWLSIRPILGIEMARVLITPDSIKFINNLKQSVYIRSTDSRQIQNLFHIPLDFQLLQNIITGNPAFLPKKLKHMNMDSTTVYLTLINDSLTCSYQLSRDSLHLKKSHFQINNSPEYADQQFSAYKKLNNGLFSFRRSLRLQAENTTNVQITFDKVIFDKPVAMPFHYNTHYKNR